MAQETQEEGAETSGEPSRDAQDRERDNYQVSVDPAVIEELAGYFPAAINETELVRMCIQRELERQRDKRR